jgi:hypothetical protein
MNQEAVRLLREMIKKKSKEIKREILADNQSLSSSDGEFEKEPLTEK